MFHGQRDGVLRHDRLPGRGVRRDEHVVVVLQVQNRLFLEHVQLEWPLQRETIQQIQSCSENIQHLGGHFCTTFWRRSNFTSPTEHTTRLRTVLHCHALFPTHQHERVFWTLTHRIRHLWNPLVEVVDGRAHVYLLSELVFGGHFFGRAGQSQHSIRVQLEKRSASDAVVGTIVSSLPRKNIASEDLSPGSCHQCFHFPPRILCQLIPETMQAEMHLGFQRHDSPTLKMIMTDETAEHAQKVSCSSRLATAPVCKYLVRDFVCLWRNIVQAQIDVVSLSQQITQTQHRHLLHSQIANNLSQRFLFKGDSF